MSKRKEPQKQLTRRQLARHEREARTQRILMSVAIAVGVVIVSILAYGSITEIIKARRPVARVGTTTITSTEFKNRQSYERWMTELEIYQYQNYLAQLNAQQDTETPGEEGEEGVEGPQLPSPTTDSSSNDMLIQQLQLSISNLEQQLSSDFANLYAGQVLDSMIEEELLRQAAEERGLTVTEDELQRRIELTLGYDREAATATLTETESLTDTAAAAALAQPDFDQLYEQFDANVLQVTRYPEDKFQAMMRAQVLRSKLQETLAADLETVRDQVELTVFTVESEETGEALRTRINEGGEDPATIVEAYRDDEDDVTAGYDLPWLPAGYLSSQFGEDVEKAAFNTSVGKASAPVTGQGGSVYVLYVNGHEERELSPDLLGQAEQEAYETWLTEQKNEKAEYLEWEEAVVEE